MKKQLVVLMGLIACFASCSDDEDTDKAYNVDFTVSPREVMKNFKDVVENTGDLEPGDSKLRLSAFIYDQEDNLVWKKEQLADNYETDFRFSEALPSGRYRVIGLSSIVEGNALDNLEVEFWKYSKTESLDIFTLEQHNFSTKAILGLAEHSLIVENGTASATLRLKPATAMLELHWMEPQRFDLGDPVGHQLLSSHETFTGLTYRSPEWEPFGRLGSSQVWVLSSLGKETCTQTQYTDIYGLHALLPQDLSYYVKTDYVDKAGVVKYQSYGASSIALEAGKQHVLNITPFDETAESSGIRSSAVSLKSSPALKTCMRVKTLSERTVSVNR